MPMVHGVLLLRMKLLPFVGGGRSIRARRRGGWGAGAVSRDRVVRIGEGNTRARRWGFFGLRREEGGVVREKGSVFRHTRPHLYGSAGQRCGHAVSLGDFYSQRAAEGDGAATDRGAGWREAAEPADCHPGAAGGHVPPGRGIPSGVFRQQSAAGVLRVRGGAQVEEVPREVRRETAQREPVGDIGVWAGESACPPP